MNMKQFLVIASLTLAPLWAASAFAQKTKQVVQLAKLEIDPARLDAYKAALKEGVETALRIEPGVLSLYAMAEKENPAHITLVEIYADENAYQAHLQSPHFLKDKTGTKDMVKSLELIKTVPLFPGMKGK